VVAIGVVVETMRFRVKAQALAVITNSHPVACGLSWTVKFISMDVLGRHSIVTSYTARVHTRPKTHPARLAPAHGSKVTLRTCKEFQWLAWVVVI